MTSALFPAFAPDDEDDMRRTLARSDAAVLVLERDGGDSLAGFIEAGARSIADGCSTSPVGYVEAWYVDPDARRAGNGRALLEAAEGWARAQGYTEMASDALLDNLVSHEAHKRSGYIEVDRQVTFRKPLV
jgi:aminoglycoside 6'-N-acetyltransferase I